MALGKKAIMVEFLVGVLIALMIFIPTCLFTTGFFRISDQAQDNFGQIVKEIREITKPGRQDDVKTVFLIMDEGTSIVTFKANQPHEVEHGGCIISPALDLTAMCKNNRYWVDKTDYDGGEVGAVGTAYTFTSTTYPYPSACKGEDCICLCQERTVETHPVQEDVVQPRVSQYSYQDNIATCTKLLCESTQGIDIEKFHYYRDETDQRRVLLQIAKKADVIYLTVK